MQSNRFGKLKRDPSPVGNFVGGLASAGDFAAGRIPVGERPPPGPQPGKPPTCEAVDRSTARLHVGILMDGNGRWATRQGLSRLRGHEAGVKAIQRTVQAAPEHGVGTLTLYAFSSDNWRRPAAEVTALMGLLKFYLANEVAGLARNGIRLSWIGRRDRLPDGVAAAMERAEAATAGGTALHLRIAVDYSARVAILHAAAQAAGIGELTRESFSQLITGEAALRDVDLIIRTSGEQRLSDFLLWESAYAELHFTERLWPDFAADDLAAALASFRARDRRFGGLQPTAPEMGMRQQN
jgi:undecaprenyl diphosphate synthase